MDVSTDVTSLIPEDVATRFQVVPVARTGRVLKVAMANPSNIFAIDDIKFITGLEVQPVVCTETEIKGAIDRYYDSADSLKEVLEGLEEDVEIVEEEDDNADVGSLSAESENAPVVKLVNSMLVDAVKRGASDIHVECYERAMRVRYRVDGILQEMMSPPVKMKSAIISRLKIMSELDIAERRVPQDGRIKLKVGEKKVDMRVSSSALHLRRKSRDAYPGQGEPEARPRRVRHVQAGPRAHSKGQFDALRHGAGHRAHRFR